MGKGHAPRPSTPPGDLLPPTRVRGALPATCTQVDFNNPWSGKPLMWTCNGQVQRVARRVPDPGTIAGRCARCGHIYTAPE